LRRRHLLACEQAAQRLHDHEQPDRPNGDRLAGPVLLPLPDRAPDLQRDADLDSLARARSCRQGALAPPVGLEPADSRPPFELSLEGAFSFSFSAGAPPAAPTSLEPSLPA